MRRLTYVVTALAAFATLVSCADKNSTATVLYFTEQEAGGEPYPTRMLVTDAYLRIDDGKDADGFVLFDRTAEIIYSTNPARRTTLVIKPLKIELAPPREFSHSAERGDDELPDFDGRKVVHYRLLTNKQACFDVYAADGLLPDAVAALRKYHETLAGEQAAMQAHMPADLQSICDYADYVFRPARYLDHGFPVKQVSRAGRRRELVRFEKEVRVDAALFALPKGYELFSISEIAD